MAAPAAAFGGAQGAPWLDSNVVLYVFSNDDPNDDAKADRSGDRYRLAWFDALQVAGALNANCTVLCSEDMHHGLKIDGRLTIRNPFKADS
jgi:predicted nucleic acid-binding protein